MTETANMAASFAALNTGQGFISYFREIFDPIETVYVIKGGSGTGKSRLMREVASAAKRKGYALEEFLCSSDPSSLDGIIIAKLGVAVLDGTAPHIHEPTLIGARERFLDLSAFLDGSDLKEKKEEISALCAAKSRHYQQIYEYLKVISIYDNSIHRLALNAFEQEKLEKSVEKSLLYVQKKQKYEKKVRIRSAISADGHIILNTYAKKARKRFALSDVCGVGGIYLERLLEKTDKAEVRVEVSYDPFCPERPDALYYPDAGVAFYIGTETDFDETVINMRRFIDDGILRPYKPEIRAIIRLKNAAMAQMKYNFLSVKRLHNELEAIYSSAMDFSRKESFTKEFIEKIIK